MPHGAFERLDQYTKLEATPSRTLQHLLLGFNRIDFSPGNIKQMCTRFQREPPKKAVAEVIEFCYRL